MKNEFHNGYSVAVASLILSAFSLVIVLIPRVSFGQEGCDQQCAGLPPRDYSICYQTCERTYIPPTPTPAPSTPLPSTPLPPGTGTNPGWLPGGGSSGSGSSPRTPDEVFEKLCDILGPAFAVLILISIAMVLYASFLYTTSSGDPEKIKKAGKILMYAAVAIAVALLAHWLPWIVSSIVQVSFPTQDGITTIRASC